MPVSFLVRIFFWLWFGAAIAAGHFLLLQRLPPVALPGVILVITALILLAYFRITAARTWVDSLDLRTLVLIHITRLIGVYFLMLYQRGDLPRAFVVPGSITDIIVATMALPIALAPLEAGPRRRAIVIWNVVGFIGLLLTLVNATRLNLVDPSQLRALTHLPLSLVPTFLMPLLLAIHVIIFDRTRREQTNA
jgi:hypothetical protein